MLVKKRTGDIALTAVFPLRQRDLGESGRSSAIERQKAAIGS
jgi:hypothetical protein